MSLRVRDTVSAGVVREESLNLGARLLTNTVQVDAVRDILYTNHHVCSKNMEDEAKKEKQNAVKFCKLKMSRRKVSPSFGSVNYDRIPDNRDDFVDSQFESPKRKIPWKALALASFLCVGGTILLLVGSLLVSGYIDTKYADRTWPLIILGALMFLPGSYHVRIAYCAFREYPGYSFDDIPEFD